MPLGDGDKLSKFLFAERYMRPYILPVVKKLALNKDNAPVAPQSVNLPGTLVFVIFEV